MGCLKDCLDSGTPTPPRCHSAGFDTPRGRCFLDCMPDNCARAARDGPCCLQWKDSETGLTIWHPSAWSLECRPDGEIVPFTACPSHCANAYLALLEEERLLDDPPFPPHPWRIIGSYLRTNPDGTPCTENCAECGDPDDFGPCCSPNDDTCHMRTRRDCLELNGRVMPFETCDNVRCEFVECCMTFDGHETRCRGFPTEGDCLERIGTFFSIGIVRNAYVIPDGESCAERCGSTWSCCIPMCAELPYEVCVPSGGVHGPTRTCTDLTCPDIEPIPCCTCHGCRMVDPGNCREIGGTEAAYFDSCEAAEDWCRLTGNDTGCEQSLFGLTPDLEKPGYFRPFSLHKLQPQDFGPDADNCRYWAGNFDPQVGPWICGQWDQSDTQTLRHYPCSVVFNEDGELDGLGVPRGYAAYSCAYKAPCVELN